MTELAVSATGIRKSFGSTTVLDGVDLAVPPGQVVCLIGPSGGGKSTLLRCVNHLEQPDAGEVRVFGQLIGYRTGPGGRLHAVSRKEVARQRVDIGMVFQQFNLFPHLTALENVVEAPIRVRREPRQEVADRARALLARVGLGDKHDAYPQQLSGGQQQRVAIARALAMRPKVMLFDEPTSALDPELVGEVLDTIRGLAADGMTMLVVTHEIGFAREVADHALFLADGHVLEQGPPAELLGDPRHPRTQRFLADLTRRDRQEGVR